MNSVQVSLANILKLILMGLVAAGCSQRADSKKLAQLQQFLQKQRSPVEGLAYRVLPPDVITITSGSVKEIDGIEQAIRPDGKITLPLVGELFVAGLTPQEIRQEITNAAHRYYKKVDVTVYIAQYNSQKIYVFGEVAAPGPLAWTGSDTLLDIMSRARPTLLAWPEKVKVIRSTKPRRGGYIPGAEEDNGKSPTTAPADEPLVLNKQGAQELTVDLMAMVKTGDLSHNILLQPDDVIYVPSNPLASVGLAFQQILFPVRGIVDTVEAPGDVDAEYWYWKNRKEINTVNVHHTGENNYSDLGATVIGSALVH